MKRVKQHFIYSCIMLLMLGICSCTVEELEDSGNYMLEYRSALPSVTNNMLHFNNYADFIDFIEDISLSEQDTTEILNAFFELGVDLNDTLLPNLTFFPVALSQEMQLVGFASARKVEENFINESFNNGIDTVNSIIHDPYYKSAINEYNSVHIGTRIFTFYPNNGITIVLDNDWIQYNLIKGLSFNEIEQTNKVFVTSREFNDIDKIYFLDSEGIPFQEKPYVINNEDFESPYCDFSDQLIMIQLANGNIRIDFPHTSPYDIYEWTFEDGSKDFNYPLTIDCSERPSGIVVLEIWKDCPECPSGKRRICVAWVEFECKCGEKKSKSARWQDLNAGGSGRAIRIEASIWVRNGEVGCRSNLFGRRFGIWLPMNWVMTTNGVCIDILGNIKREQILVNDTECVNVNIPLAARCLQNGQSNRSLELNIPQTGNILCDPGNLTSGHIARRLPGTWCGFGIDVPRLVLD